MIRTVWKYAIEINRLDQWGMVHIEMPVGAQIRHVAINPNDPAVIFVWTEVKYDPATPASINRERRTFTVVGTGHNVAEDYSYVGTAMTANAALVWHVYEVPL